MTARRGTLRAVFEKFRPAASPGTFDLLLRLSMRSHHGMTVVSLVVWCLLAVLCAAVAEMRIAAFGVAMLILQVYLLFPVTSLPAWLARHRRLDEVRLLPADAGAVRRDAWAFTASALGFSLVPMVVYAAARLTLAFSAATAGGAIWGAAALTGLALVIAGCTTTFGALTLLLVPALIAALALLPNEHADAFLYFALPADAGVFFAACPLLLIAAGLALHAWGIARTAARLVRPAG